MIEETATVTASEGGFAQVETQRETACGGCSAKSACGTSALAKLFANRRASVRVLNPIGARPGEEVIVGLDESALTRVSFVFYIIPLLSLFLFAAGGEWLSGYLGFAATELYSIFGGLLGLSLGLAYLRVYAARPGSRRHHQAVILRYADRFATRFPAD